MTVTVKIPGDGGDEYDSYLIGFVGKPVGRDWQLEFKFRVFVDFET